MSVQAYPGQALVLGFLGVMAYSNVVEGRIKETILLVFFKSIEVTIIRGHLMAARLDMRTFVFIALLLVQLQTMAQGVEDSDKRGFDELAPIYLDLDGDGRQDAIQPRTYSRSSRGRVSQQRTGTRRTHWITFDLKFATGKRLVSFFSYRYGDDRADYWVWALKEVGDRDRDGRTDLVFYSGDDTTDETVVLLQRSNGFKASSSGVILCDLCSIDGEFNVVSLGLYDVEADRKIPDRIVARWNPSRGYFEGDGLMWIRAGRVAMRETPARSARILEWFHKDDAVLAMFKDGRPIIKGVWIMVESTYGTGWMERAKLVSSSRWVQP